MSTRRGHPARRVSYEKVAALPPAQSWEPETAPDITAGNSSQTTDGAAAMLIASRETADALGLPYRAVLRHFSVAAEDPILVLSAPNPATRKLYEKTGLSTADFDAVECNEAFAAIALMWAAEFKPDPERYNPNGGAIAIGHPLGATGVRMTATLLNQLEATGGRLGLQTMCEGGGQANCTVIERRGLDEGRGRERRRHRRVFGHRRRAGADVDRGGRDRRGGRPPRGTAAAAMVDARRGGALLRRATSTIPSAAEAMILHAWDDMGGVDILVNNAAIPKRRSGAGPHAGARSTRRCASNFESPVRMTQALLPKWLERDRGMVVNVSSFGGRAGIMHEAAYCASKFALVRMERVDGDGPVAHRRATCASSSLAPSTPRSGTCPTTTIRSSTATRNRRRRSPQGSSTAIEGDAFELYVPDMKSIAEFKMSNIDVFLQGNVEFVEAQQ